MSDILLNRLATIIEALELIERRMVKIKKADAFVDTEEGQLIMDAIAIRLQVIGETTKKIDLQQPDFLPSIGIDPKPIIRFRDFISHHYDEADYEVLFEICTNHLPLLKAKLEKQKR
ncbi:MAG: DUF86 domain-containing protein [Saprospirales bacterium]|jgi:uncharacterized protein with HEPN domain|nr:DUF86 domain-containing protein [Saprospirales bacterium]